MLQQITAFITYTVLTFPAGSRLGESVHFFLYDSIKLLSILFVFVSFIGFLRSFVPQQRIKEWVQRKHKLVSHTAAASFGALTPFCSCSSIPIFLSFIKAGLPLGVTFSFLITSPILNEYLFVLMLGYFGIKVSVLYALSGLLIGIAAGLILDRMKLEHNLEPDVANADKNPFQHMEYPDVVSRVRYGFREGAAIVSKIWKWVLAGIAIGALIHNFIPQQTIQGVVAAGGILTVPLVVLLGVPLYGSCAAIVPIAVVLFNKGLPLGTVLAFMMAVSALSLPEAIILRRAMNLKLIGIFFGIVFLSIVFTGYLFNFLGAYLL